MIVPLDGLEQWCRQQRLPHARVYDRILVALDQQHSAYLPRAPRVELVEDGRQLTVTVYVDDRKLHRQQLELADPGLFDQLTRLLRLGRQLVTAEPAYHDL